MSAMQRMKLILALAALTLGFTACGGGEAEPESSTTNAPSQREAEDSTSTSEPTPAPEEGTASTGVEVRDDTPENAIITWMEGVKQANMDAALAVLDASSQGAEALRDMKRGWEAAAAEGAPVGLAQGLIAAEIETITYEQISNDGETAIFRFSKPSVEQPWEIRVIATENGWRVIPPEAGLPQSPTE